MHQDYTSVTREVYDPQHSFGKQMSTLGVMGQSRGQPGPGSLGPWAEITSAMTGPRVELLALTLLMLPSAHEDTLGWALSPESCHVRELGLGMGCLRPLIQ